jgi:hypothetical protein
MWHPRRAATDSFLPYFTAGQPLVTNQSTTDAMKSEGQNQSGEQNYGTIIPTPRFDEEAKATARPVMPLRRVNGSDIHTGLARGARSTILTANSWVRSLMITLALGTVIVALIALFANNETASPDSPPAINGAASVIGFEPATETLLRTEEMADTSNASAKSPRESQTRSGLPVRYEIRRDDSREEEHRGRDEVERDDEDDDDKEKIAKRARKEEKKRLERRRKEAEKLAERRRDAEKDGEPKPRLIGIYTEKP